MKLAQKKKAGLLPAVSVLVFLLASSCAHRGTNSGGEYATGAILDPVLYEQVDAKPVLVSRSYTSLPGSVSLKQYAPIPESQGQIGACVAWATAFAARTISESVVLNRTDRTETSANAFSPTHVYRSVGGRGGPYDGISVSSALAFMKNPGVAKRPSAERAMYPNIARIPLTLFANVRHYPISGYVRLSSYNSVDIISAVKKSLSEKKPVIISMKTPHSFERVGVWSPLTHYEVVWQPREDPYKDYTGHAMCVVGYDDNKHGGAFEIQNSWGTSWGNDGYVWIRYQDFANWVKEAYEIIEDLSIYREAARFAASIEIQVYNSVDGMPVTYDNQGFYKTNSPYPGGTIFRYLMTNSYPAYVYAFSADSYSADIERIFPLSGVSPVLDYADSTVAWPGEHDWIEIDNGTGTDYLVVLYAKEALDIDAIERRFAAERGSLPERVQRAAGPDFIPFNNADYTGNRIEFSAQSQNPNAVFGLLLAVDHR